MAIEGLTFGFVVVDRCRFYSAIVARLSVWKNPSGFAVSELASDRLSDKSELAHLTSCDANIARFYLITSIQ